MPKRPPCSGITLHGTHSGQRNLPTVLLSFALAMLLVEALIPCGAYATPVEEAQATLNDAEATMAQITEEYNALLQVVEDLQDQIDETAAAALEAQAAYLEGRENLERSAVFSYTSASPLQFLDWIFGSKSIPDLIRTVDYIDSIMAYQAKAIEEQRTKKLYFDQLSQELNEQKNEQEEALTRLEAKKAEAEAVVDAAREQLNEAEAEEAARLAELARAAAALEREENTAAAEINPDADTTDRKDVVEGGSSTPAPNPAPPDTSNASGWLSGVASAYGGSTDPYTPNPGTTATGAVCDDYSMGVAIPMSLPNYRSYLGRTVEISYNGMTVYATVNDCGYMGGGSRVLDLQPGVWKAFGFSSCQAWGVRTVSYRFL